MSVFQIVGIALAAVLSAMMILGAMRRRISRRVALAWLLVWLAAGTAIARPELTVVIAHAMGIARGADLVFYCGILVMLIGFMATYARLRRVESALSTLVREIALHRAELEETGGPHPSVPRTRDPGSEGRRD